VYDYVTFLSEVLFYRVEGVKNDWWRHFEGIRASSCRDEVQFRNLTTYVQSIRVRNRSLVLVSIVFANISVC
jgi:hypothetical protein